MIERIERVNFRKLGAYYGLISTNRGVYAVQSSRNFEMSFVLAFKDYSQDNILYLNSYFVSGYGNIAGIKDTTHYNKIGIKAIRALDKSFKISADGRAISKDFTIKIVALA